MHTALQYLVVGILNVGQCSTELNLFYKVVLNLLPWIKSSYSNNIIIYYQLKQNFGVHGISNFFTSFKTTVVNLRINLMVRILCLSTLLRYLNFQASYESMQNTLKLKFSSENSAQKFKFYKKPTKEHG